MRGRQSLFVIAVAAMAAACGGSNSNLASSPSASTSAPTTPADPATSRTASPTPACAPAGTELKINTIAGAAPAFSTKCLAAPADAAFTIEFDNRAGVPHDVAIATEGLIDVLFEGEVITGPKDITYKVKAIPAGIYVFYCKVHPTLMNGTFVAS